MSLLMVTRQPRVLACSISLPSTIHSKLFLRSCALPLNAAVLAPRGRIGTLWNSSARRLSSSSKHHSHPRHEGYTSSNGRPNGHTKHSIDDDFHETYHSNSRLFRPLRRLNTFINFVHHQEAWVVERFGAFNRIISSGFHIVIPFFERIAYVHNLKEICIPVYPQPAITQDNVQVKIGGNVYIQVTDPKLASYGVEDPVYNITQLAQTAMRSEIGKISLDRTFEERENLNGRIVAAIDGATKSWGIKCLRYEIKDIVPPVAIQESMNMQAEAERRRRQLVLEYEGVKRSKELESEGYKIQQINQAEGDAKATLLRAEAQALALKVIGNATSTEGGELAMKMRLAEEFIKEYGKLAQKSNTIIIPDDPNNIGNWVGKAMGIMGAIGSKGSSDNLNKL